MNARQKQIPIYHTRCDSHPDPFVDDSTELCSKNWSRVPFF